jgi:hypothetical protein
MTFKEYVGKYVKRVNNHITIAPIPKSAQYCEKCFDDSDELTLVTFDKQRNKWVCAKGHEADNDPLPRGGLVRMPHR